jgi:hypothetical protein
VCGEATITLSTPLNFIVLADDILTFDPYDALLEGESPHAFDLIYTDQDGIATTVSVNVTVDPCDCDNPIHEMIVTTWVADSDVIDVDVFTTHPVL